MNISVFQKNKFLILIKKFCLLKGCKIKLQAFKIYKSISRHNLKLFLLIFIFVQTINPTDTIFNSKHATINLNCKYTLNGNLKMFKRIRARTDNRYINKS